MSVKIPFSRVSIGEEEKEAVARVMESGWLAPGPETEAFEREFSDYVAPPGEHYYCIFTNSCTSALKMAYKLIKERNPGLGRLTYYPENTFCATYSAGIEMGVNMVPENILTDGPDVVMHYGGVKVDFPCIIEDSAHRIEPNDPLVGEIRCYSFYATKNMTTGAGGMFVTNNKETYDRARLYWKDGLTTSTADRQSGPVDYEVRAFAGGYDSTDMAAALGRVQLGRLPDLTARRNEIRDRYNAAFAGDWMGNHLYCVDLSSVERVSECRRYLWDLGIGSGYHYPGTGWTKISLPIYPDLTEEEQNQVIEAMRKGGYV